MTSDPLYQSYSLMQRINELKQSAESSLSYDSINALYELMEEIECWHLDGDTEKTVYSFVEFVKKHYWSQTIVHRPVESIVDAWFHDAVGSAFAMLPSLEADELFLFGWLAVFALRKSYAPVKASVELDLPHEEFVIKEVKHK